MLKKYSWLSALALLGQAACLGSVDGTPPSSVQDERTQSNAPPQVRPLTPEETTSLWMQYGDPALLAARAAEEGPIDVASRRHACFKFKFQTLGQVLIDLGVNMANTATDPAPVGTMSLVPLEVALRNVADPQTFCNNLVPGATSQTNAMERAAKVAQSARYLYCTSRLTLGMPPYQARLAEPTSSTTAGNTKLFDTLAGAAVELARDNLSRATRCMDAGGNRAMLFNADNTCNADGMACLQGYPPSAEQVNLCNRLVVGAEASPAMTVTLTSTGTVSVPAVDQVTSGKRVAAAAVLANALLCE